MLPRILKFWLSDVHKKSILELYRRLLYHVKAFKEPLASVIKYKIRKGFSGSTGKGLRSINKTREALVKGYQAEELLCKAAQGEEEALLSIHQRFPGPRGRVNSDHLQYNSSMGGAFRDQDKNSAPAERRARPAQTVTGLRRPEKPLHLNYDSQRNPFLRPRKHDQNQAMILKWRNQQHQKRLDRGDELQYQLLLARAEEQFYSQLGRAEEGFEMELKLHVSHLKMQLAVTEERKHERWKTLAIQRDKMAEDYEIDMKEYRTKLSAKVRLLRAQQELKRKGL